MEVIQPVVPADGEERATSLAEYAAVEVGLTGVSGGLADAGSLVMEGRAGRSQLASLRPPIHLAVLESSEIFPSFTDWLAAGGAARVTEAENVILIAGPSRTADIEMTLTIGVHGPRRVVVFLVD